MTPKPIIAFLNKHLNEVIQTELFKKRMEALGMTVPVDNTPDKFAEFMRSQTARQAELAKLSGHTPLGSQR